MISAVTGIITSIAGGGTLLGTSADGGPATAADLSTSYGLVADGSDLYLSNYDFTVSMNTIRKVDLATGIISTVPGSSTRGTVYAGPVYGIDLDAAGDFFFPLTTTIAELPAGASATTNVVGANSCWGVGSCPPQLGDGGPAQSGFLNEPMM